MKRQQIISLGLALICLIAFFAINRKLSSHNVKKDKKNASESTKFLKTDSVVYKNYPTTLKTFGIVQSSRKISLFSEVQGQILSSSVQLKPGAKFKKGDLIIKIDDEIFQHNLRSQKSEFMKLVANMLPDLRIDFPNEYEKWSVFFEKLHVNKALPPFPETSNVQLKTFVANKLVYKSYYTILSEQEKLSKYNIYAPYDGTFSEVLVDIGSTITPSTKIATIIDSKNLEIEIALKSVNLQYVKVGQEVSITYQNDTEKITGKISRIADFINQKTQTILVYIPIKTNDSKLMDGTYVNCVINGKDLKSSVKVNREAIANNHYIYELKNEELKPKKITVLFEDDSSAYITGIEKGTVFVNESIVKSSVQTKYKAK